MLCGHRIIPRQLVSAGEAEFGGQVKRIQCQALFKRCDGLIVASHLRMKLAEKVERVWVVRIEARNLFERFDGGIGLCKRSISDTEVVPGACILRLPASRIE